MPIEPTSETHRDAVRRELRRVRTDLGDLRRQHTQLVEAMRADNADDEHDPEGATLAWEREHLAALTGRARERQDTLLAALARLDGGWSGACEGCGASIPVARLLARPEATRCVTCAQTARSGGR